ncbi:hypothetical protein [Xanthomonas fragariae]|uniref:hypothetical protein n=1 Tax=Xanthomonas fragariae TaxID=48664 RepID=UPI0022AA7239|nr:hypothetical protein [Xanthomonas fragariae]WAT14576.1 hypothetical protein OZ429_16575 [Xanthomonas fragariae]
MISHWLLLNDKDRDAVRTLMAFLQGRLAEQATIEWALKTKPHEIVKRSAVLQSLEFLNANDLKDPWYSAWRLIEQSWEEEAPWASSSDAYHLQNRIQAGERSGSLISSIDALVKPRLKLSARSEQYHSRKLKRPRRVEDLFHASISSHDLADLEVFRLDYIEEIDFLIALGTVLDSAVNEGLNLGRRLGWEGDYNLWQLGDLYYAGYLIRDYDGFNQDVDKFHHGIAPAVKLLDAVVKRIAAIDVPQARAFVSRWKQMQTPVHLRLWASLSQISELTTPQELADVLPALEDRPFWDVHAFPEIAELRAIRFNQVSDKAQRNMVARLKRGPPATFWPRGSDRDRVKGARQYWAARELRRIELAGSQLPLPASKWLAERLDMHPELREMHSMQFDFLSSAMQRRITPEPDERYNDLSGEERLRALEAALASDRSSWNDDPAERAGDWIRTGENADSILSDLEAARDGGADYPNVWDRFGWAHSVPSRDVEETQEYLQTADRILTLLERLPSAVIKQAIQGITHWMSAREGVITRLPGLSLVWAKLWPVAVAATNRTEDTSDAVELNEIITAAQDGDPADLDTLNTATGRLVGVFLAMCPTMMHGDENPFEASGPLRTMREAIVSAEGKSGLIGRHRLIEALPYFLKADEAWSQDELVGSLVANDASSLALWRAISRRTQFTAVLREIGDHFADRAVDRRLGRRARGSLLSSLVLESLHAFREGREPAVSNAKIQQTLRAVEDEVRATAAHIVQRFLIEMSKNPSLQLRQSAEDVFRGSVAPFLGNVWPQERSLATRGVAAAFADLPAAADNAFAEAVDAISRFMVPFDCWSMHDFGFRGEVEGIPRLESIDTPAKAAALLRLLDMSIGASEGSVVPMDLAEGLDQIRRASANLAQDPAFRRLAAISRYR